MTGTEKNFAELSGELREINGALSALTARLKALGGRADSVSRQLKRGIAVRDLEFENDFRQFVEDFRELAEEAGDFWKAAAPSALRKKSETSGARGFSAQVKAASAAAAEFASALRYFNSLVKDSALKLNCWELDALASDLSHSCGKAPLLARELSKTYD